MWPEELSIRAGNYRHRVTGGIYTITSANFDSGLITLEKDGAEYFASAETFIFDYEEAQHE